jgi:hypothetical protein
MAVTPTGNMMFGSSEEPSAGPGQAQAAIWTRSGSSPTGWEVVRLGVLPGTDDWEGRSVIEDGSSDGSILTGLNFFTNFNIGYFIWTLEVGLEPVADYFDRVGVNFPTSFRIQRISAISENGRVIAGYGYDLYNPGATVSFLVTTSDPTSVPVGGRRAGLAIEASYPNPFNPSTTIALRVEATGPVKLEIFDLRGALVRVLQDGNLAAGRHEYVWDGKTTDGLPVASGVFLARARSASGGTAIHRLMLVK